MRSLSLGSSEEAVSWKSFPAETPTDKREELAGTLMPGCQGYAFANILGSKGLLRNSCQILVFMARPDTEKAEGMPEDTASLHHMPLNQYSFLKQDLIFSRDV